MSAVRLSVVALNAQHTAGQQGLLRAVEENTAKACLALDLDLLRIAFQCLSLLLVGTVVACCVVFWCADKFGCCSCRLSLERSWRLGVLPVCVMRLQLTGEHPAVRLQATPASMWLH